MRSIDPAQLTDWFAAHAGAMALYARQWLSPAEADDAVQEVFVRLLARRPHREPESVRAWLLTALRNEAINRLRSRKRRRRHEDAAAAARTNWFSPRVDDVIDAQAVQAALAGQPREQREVVVLRIWAGLSFEQIGKMVGLSAATAFRRYRDALASLRERMVQPCQKISD